MKEVVLDFMLLFLALKALLKHKDDEMGKRGKRKNKFKNVNWNKEAEALDITSKEKRKKEEEDSKLKPFERVKLPPPREAQEGHI